MKIIFLIILSLLFFACTKEITEYIDDRPVKIIQATGHCQERITFHWNSNKNATHYRIFGGCASCLQTDQINGTCNVGLHYLDQTSDLHYTKETSPKECRSYMFAIKAVKGEHESDFSNIIRCTTDKLNPDYPVPQPVINKSVFETPELFGIDMYYDGVVYMTPDTDRGFKWDTSSPSNICPDPDITYNVQAVYIQDPAHPTTYELGSTQNCTINVTMPATPIGFYKIQVNACNTAGCSEWANSDNEADAQVCDLGTDLNCRDRAWIIYLKLKPPIISF